MFAYKEKHGTNYYLCVYIVSCKLFLSVCVCVCTCISLIFKAQLFMYDYKGIYVVCVIMCKLTSSIKKWELRGVDFASSVKNRFINCDGFHRGI